MPPPTVAVPSTDTHADADADPHDPTHPGAGSGHGHGHRRGPRPRVFLVDDDAGLRACLRDLLGEAGCELVGEAADAIEAVARVPMAAVHGPVVVLMDVRMPGELNGIDATRLVLARTGNARILIFSAFGGGEGIAEAARAAGASGVLIKGMPAGELLRAIQDVWAGLGSR